MDCDVVVVGAGLAGLVAASELAAAGRRVILCEQEPAQSLGGQAFWALGGLFLVDTPEQRRLGIRDSLDLAWQDWLGSAGFDRADDAWPSRWARAYVEFSADEARAWLRGLGVRFFPIVGWAERGGFAADGPGNSVPRFHLAWGTGPGVLAPFVRQVRQAMATGRVEVRFRHRVEALTRNGGVVDGVAGSVLAPSDVARGVASNRQVVGGFAVRAQAVVLTSGGIGGDPDLVRAHWPARLGTPPRTMLTGVPAHVDGRMLGVAAAAGAAVVHTDRLWCYPEGIINHTPIWARHAIRILPGPSSLWLDARGHRLPVPLYPGFDTLSVLTHLRGTGFDHSWFLLNRRIIAKEFALSGSDQNPDLTGRSLRGLARRLGGDVPAPVDAFVRHGVDFVLARTLPELVAGMNARVGAELIDAEALSAEVTARDRALAHPFGKDSQLMAVRAARRYRGDRLLRVTAPHPLLDPAAGPLIAVRLHVLTRKTLGGLHTDLTGRVLGTHGGPLPGVYAAGEVAGFGGGGMHGYRALEGSFLGGCLFSGRVAGRTAAAATA